LASFLYKKYIKVEGDDPVSETSKMHVNSMLSIKQRLISNKEGIIVWAALVLNMILVFIQRLYIGVMPDYLMQKFAMDIGQLSFLTSAAFYGYAFFQIPSGLLIDKVGVRTLNIWGGLLTLIGSILFSMTSNYNIAWLARFLIGAGTSVVIISIMKVQALWFKPIYFSQLSALMSFISNLGMFAGTLPLAVLIKFIGAQNTLYIISVFSLLGLILVLFFVREKKISEEDLDVSNIHKARGFFAAIKEVMTTRGTYPSMFIIFFFISTMTSIMGLWAVNYLTNVYDMTKIVASGYVVFFTFGFIVGSPVMSISDRILKGDYKKSLLFFTGVYFLLWFYFLVIKSGKPPVVQIPIIFFLMGIAIMVHILAFTASKDANKIENAGVATSVVNTMEFIGSGLINFLIAFNLQRGVPAEKAFLIILIFSAGAFIASIFVRFDKQVHT